MLARGGQAELFSEVAYAYDGSLEGLLSAIFAAYERRENPTDVEPGFRLQPRIDQRVSLIDVNLEHAERVRAGLAGSCGPAAYSAMKAAALCSEAGSGTAAYRFVRYAYDAAPSRRRAFSDVAHPDVAPLRRIWKRVGTERERMLQFVRFEELEGGLWFARCNPQDSVIPLVMDHFASRFNTQAFIIYDEAHGVAGVYEGRDWYLVNVADGGSLNIPPATAREAQMRAAWKAFYRSVSVEARYNPELRRHFMPKRLWRNITEMQEDLPGLSRKGSPCV